MLFEFDRNKIIEDIRRLEVEILKKSQIYADKVKIGHVDTELLNKEINSLISEIKNKTRFLCEHQKYKNEDNNI